MQTREAIFFVKRKAKAKTMDRVLFVNIDREEYYQGHCYGHVRTAGRSKIKLHRIELAASKDSENPKDPKELEVLDKVLIIVVATNPDTGGSYIAGWYKNAKVYADRQTSDNPELNKHGYHIMAKEEDCHLLPAEERTFYVPRATAANHGFLGGANIWYADRESPSVQEFRKKAIEYVRGLSNR